MDAEDYLFSQRRTQLRESREAAAVQQPSSLSSASNADDRGFYAAGRRGSFDHSAYSAAEHLPSAHKMLSSSISSTSASRAAILEHQTSGGTLVQRSVVRGRHKKGLDIVGESAQVEAEEDISAFSPNAFGTPVSEFASGASTPIQRAASVGLHDSESGFSPASSVSAMKGHELMRKTASASISPPHTFVESKDPQTRAFLQDILSQHYLFSSLAPAALDEVINAMQSIPVGSGEIVVKEGDIVHNAFYVVQRGMFDIYGSHSSAAFDALASTKSNTPRTAAVESGKPVFLTSICAGGTFGEAALMYSAPADLTVRAATMSATNASTIAPSSARSFGSLDFDDSSLKTSPAAQPEHLDVDVVLRSPRAPCLQLDIDGTAKHPSVSVFSAVMASPMRSQVARDSAEHLLWRLDRRTFRKALTAFSSKNAATIQEALRSISLFKSLTPGQLAKLGYAVREEHFAEGDKIITKGSPGESMYFLLSGEVVCTNIGSGSIAIADVPLKTGACFGERALLLEEPRAADVIVTSQNATVLTLDRLGVTQLLGPLQELIYKNVVIGALRSIPTFSAMAEADIDKLASCAHVVTFTRGQKIVGANEASSCMYIVREGTARVVDRLDGAAPLLLLPGDYVNVEQLLRPNTKPAKDVVCHTEKMALFALEHKDVVASFDTVDWLQSAAPSTAGVETASTTQIDPIDGGSLPFLRSVAQPVDVSIVLEDLERVVTVGVGTFGRVYLVRHVNSGQLYALKELKKLTVISMNQMRNVQYEKAVMAAVRHPFLLRLVNTYQDAAKLYMLTEYIHGGELFNLLGEYEKLSSSHAKFYAACVLSGLAHLHHLGIVYRDLKPENLLIDRQGYIRIVDFGFCKHIPPGDRTYTLCGTPAYIAYEMVKGTGYTTAVDYWALGTLIYEMLVGYAPFEGDDQMTTFRNIVSGRLEFPDFIDDMYARDIIRNLLARDVVDRLGCRKDGAQEIFEHPWFRDMDFAELVEKRTEAPWLPELEAEDDCRYFESYEDSEGEANADADADGLDESPPDGNEERAEEHESEEDEEEQEDGEEEDRFSFVDAIPERLVAHPDHVPSLGMSSISESIDLPWFEGF